MEIKKLNALFFFMIFIVVANGGDTNKDDWGDYGSFHYYCDCSCDTCPICPNSPVPEIPKKMKINNSSGCWCWCECPPCPPPQSPHPVPSTPPLSPPTKGRPPPSTPPKKTPHTPPKKEPHSPSPSPPPPKKKPHPPSPTPPKKKPHSPSPKPKCTHLHVIKEFIELTIKNIISATNDIDSLPVYYRYFPIAQTLNLCITSFDESYTILKVAEETTQFVDAGLSPGLQTEMKSVMSSLGHCSDALTQYVNSFNYTPLDESTVDMLNNDLNNIYHKMSDLKMLIPSLDKCT